MPNNLYTGIKEFDKFLNSRSKISRDKINLFKQINLTGPSGRNSLQFTPGSRDYGNRPSEFKPQYQNLIGM